jgi:hypothetical protein
VLSAGLDAMSSFLDEVVGIDPLDLVRGLLGPAEVEVNHVPGKLAAVDQHDSRVDMRYVLFRVRRDEDPFAGALSMERSDELLDLSARKR